MLVMEGGSQRTRTPQNTDEQGALHPRHPFRQRTDGLEGEHRGRRAAVDPALAVGHGARDAAAKPSDIRRLRRHRPLGPRPHRLRPRLKPKRRVERIVRGDLRETSLAAHGAVLIAEGVGELPRHRAAERAGEAAGLGPCLLLLLVLGGRLCQFRAAALGLAGGCAFGGRGEAGIAAAGREDPGCGLGKNLRLEKGKRWRVLIVGWPLLCQYSNIAASMGKPVL